MVRSLEPERKASRTIGQDKKLIVKSRVVLRDDFVATKSPQDDTRFTIFLIKKDPRTYRTVRGSLRGDKISIGRLFRSIKMK